MARQPGKAALVVGAGDATGGAIARAFVREGYVACVTRRHADKLAPLVGQIEAEGGQARAFGSDARREEQVVALVARIEAEVGPIEVLVFNIGANVPEGILEETARKYYKIWEMACFAGFLNAREVARRMVARPMPGQRPPWHLAVYRRHRFVARQRPFCRLFRCQDGVARAGAKHGARTGAAGRARGACCD